MESKKASNLVRLFYALIVCAILGTAVLVINTAQRFTDAQSDWENFNAEAVSKGVHLAQIRRAFGYGGIIHNFKNLVLRQELALADSIADDFKTIQTTIDAFREQSDDPEEHEALGHIADALENYVSNVGVAVALTAQGKTPREIDQAVRVDDTHALVGLRLLETNWLQAGVRAGNSSAVVLSEAEREINLAFGTIVIALGVGIVLLVMARREAVIKDHLGEELRRNQERYALAARYGRTAPWEILLEDRKILADENLSFLLGIEGEAPPSTLDEWAEYLLPEDVGLMAASIQRVADGKAETFSVEYRVQDKGGNIRSLLAAGQVAERIDGRPSRIVGTTRDITDQKKAEKELRTSEERLTEAHRIAQIGHWNYDAGTQRITLYGGLYGEFHSYGSATEFSIEDSLRPAHPEDIDHVRSAFMQAISEGTPYDQSYRIIGAEGEIRHIHVIGEIVRDDDGAILAMRGTTQDITAHKEAEAALQRSEERYAMAAEFGRSAAWEIFPEQGKIYSDKNLAALMGSPDNLPPSELDALMDTIHEDDRDHVVQAMLDVFEGRTKHFAVEHRTTLTDGSTAWRRDEGYIASKPGEPVRIVGTTSDITERKQAERELQRTQDKLSAAQRIAGIGSWELNSNRLTSVWSEEMYRIFDLDPELDKSLAINTYYDYVHPEDADKLKAAARRTMDEREPMTLEYRIITKRGVEKTVLTFGEGEFDADGSLITFSGTLQDVTPLRETEQKLRQAQKMESVGQLSAGVAHDFNNMLAVVLGNLELLGEQLSDDLEASDLLDMALSAGERGAVLTRRLLAYSKRQTLFPEVIDLGAVLADILLLVERTIGREIAISYVVHGELTPVHVDRSQLEAALVNLAVNARDAMADGGSLTVECTNATLDDAYTAKNPNATPGDYVIVTVSDTGCGMDEDTLQKALDPFFTTKEVGKGSGLGLSMVYGFTEQSGGHLELESTLETGTTVKLYLPASEIAEITVQDKQTTDRSRPGAGHMILVVDDDEAVRKVTAKQVKSLGYEVVTAASAEEGLNVLESSQEIALLLTDIVLGPGMNGVAFALEAIGGRPQLKVLCMSGHAESEIFERYDGADRLRLIAKPFSRAVLSEQIEEIFSIDQHAAVG